MSKQPVRNRAVLRFDAETSPSAHQRDDLLVVEEPLEIRLQFGTHAEDRREIRLATTMRTPGHDHELVVGLLYSEGIIQQFDDILMAYHCSSVDAGAEENVMKVLLKAGVEPNIQFSKQRFMSTSSCGICGKVLIDRLLSIPSSSLREDYCINAEAILGFESKIRAAQTLFKHTGGLHACSLFSTKGELVYLREDIGRHNALDKLIGTLLCKHEEKNNAYILHLSGRAGYEMIQKAARAGIQMVLAIGAPSSLAVDLAEKAGITLIGFLRKSSFNIYTHPQRIIT